MPDPTAAVSGYSLPPTDPQMPAAPPPALPTTSTDPLGFVQAIEGDVRAAVNHPDVATLHKAAADLVTILGLLAAAVGFVQSVIPASRGTESTVLAGIGSGIVLVRTGIERFAG